MVNVIMEKKIKYICPQTTCQVISAMQIMTISGDVNNNGMTIEGD